MPGASVILGRAAPRPEADVLGISQVIACRGVVRNQVAGSPARVAVKPSALGCPCSLLSSRF